MLRIDGNLKPTVSSEKNRTKPTVAAASFVLLHLLDVVIFASFVSTYNLIV